MELHRHQAELAMPPPAVRWRISVIKLQTDFTLPHKADAPAEILLPPLPIGQAMRLSV